MTNLVPSCKPSLPAIMVERPRNCAFHLTQLAAWTVSLSPASENAGQYCACRERAGEREGACELTLMGSRCPQLGAIAKYDRVDPTWFSLTPLHAAPGLPSGSQRARTRNTISERSTAPRARASKSTSHVWLKLGGSFSPRRAGASSGVRNRTAHGPASVGGADAAECSNVNHGLRKPSRLADRGVLAPLSWRRAEREEDASLRDESPLRTTGEGIG
jgi:hypothetical protein